MLKGPEENKRKRKLWGEREGKQSWMYWVGGGSREVEECPGRMRAFQAIVRGKVVQKMHMIVSRCPFTLLMSLAAGHTGILSIFFPVRCACLVVQGVALCRKRHFVFS